MLPAEMYDRSIVDQSAALRRGELSSEELTRQYLARIERLDEGINAFITVAAEPALEQARSADRRLARGEGGPLTGIPLAHKDIFCSYGMRTSCGSRMLENFVAPYNATVLERFEAAGAVLLGKTNMDEFAMGSSNENSHFGPTRNPWDQSRVPGGSSGGSAAAVAARLCSAATGTDTGGSIRQPASFCGVTGLKPTYGRVSRWGMVAFASSLDQGGPIARSAADAALLLGVMAGYDARDSTSVDQPVADYWAGLEQPLQGLRVGLPTEYLGAGLEPRVKAVIEQTAQALTELGASLREISLPNAGLAVPAYYVLASAEASSNLARYDGVRYGYRCEQPRDLLDLYTRSRGEGFGAEVKRRIMVGTYVLSAGYYDAYYLKAQRIRRLISQDFANGFAEVDLMLTPVAPTPPFRLGEKTEDPVTMYLSDIYTIPVNLAGLPAIAFPAGVVDGLPVGAQLVANYFGEASLLAAAHQYQLATDWHTRSPDLARA